MTQGWGGGGGLVCATLGWPGACSASPQAVCYWCKWRHDASVLSDVKDPHPEGLESLASLSRETSSWPHWPGHLLLWVLLLCKSWFAGRAWGPHALEHGSATRHAVVFLLCHSPEMEAM